MRINVMSRLGQPVQGPIPGVKRGVYWQTIDQDPVLTINWSWGHQNDMVIILWLCDGRALLASKFQIKIQ